MPANLTPQYQKAEVEYRQAETAEERVACLERMLQLIPKHKGTEKLQADLKSKLKETRAELKAEKAAPKKGRSHRIPRQGAGQIVLLGAPNSGKSRLLAELTAAEPVVADYPFTTHEPMPGMMPWEDVSVQLIDTPPITESHIEPFLVGMVRAADAAVLCFDGRSDDAPGQTADVLRQLADRKTVLCDRTGFDEDDFSIARVKTLLVVTHGDDQDVDVRLELFREECGLRTPESMDERTASESGSNSGGLAPAAPLSRFTPHDIVRVEFDRADSREALRTRIYELLDCIRVYTKKPGERAETRDPFTIPRGGTVEDLADKVHRDLADSMQFAKVWGASVLDDQSSLENDDPKSAGACRTVGRDHALCDGDIVELHGSAK